MYNTLTENYKIMFDLSGPDKVEWNPTFIQHVEALIQKRETLFINNPLYRRLKGPAKSIRSYMFPKKALYFIENDLNTTVDKVLILSNNEENVKYFAEYGYPCIYLQTEYVPKYTNARYLPTAIWSREEFYHYCQTNTLISSFPSERIGFPRHNQPIGQLKMIEKTYELPSGKNGPTDVSIDLVLTGKYYPQRSYRYYNHPLSQAIIGLKRNNYYETKVTKQMFANVIDTFIQQNGAVDYITFVPPRPNQEHRFLGVDTYTDPSLSIDYDLLKVKTNYQTPKNSRSLTDRYEKVSGQIICTKEITGHVLLLDDVFTSGATTAECARVLYEKGAEKVTVIPLAITQDFEQNKQWNVPAVFDENGNEFRIRFNQDLIAYYESRVKDPSLRVQKPFATINKQFIVNLGKDMKKITARPFSRADRLDAVIFDLDDTLLTTSHLGYERNNRRPVQHKEKLAKVRYLIDREQLERLHNEGIKIGIVTRSPRIYAESLLEYFAIPYDASVAAWEVLKGKPAGDPILKCMKQLQVTPQHVLYIGDEDYDEQAAHRAGVMYASIDQILEENIIPTLSRYIMSLEP